MVSKAQRKALPLSFLDATLAQVETTVIAIPDPNFAKNAALVGFKVLFDIGKSIAMMKLDSSLVQNVCTGINMAAGKHFSILTLGAQQMEGV